jgi:hypothetical protein
MDKEIKKDIHDIAEYHRQIRKIQKVNLILSAVYTFLIFLFIAGTFYSIAKSGSLESFFGDKQDLSRRFNCSSDKYSDIVKTYQEADDFVNMFNGTCRLYHINGKEKEECYISHKQVQKIYFTNEGYLRIDFVNCGIVNWTACDNATETWDFRPETEPPANFKETNYVDVVKCRTGHTYYIKNINKKTKLFFNLSMGWLGQ